MHGINQVKEGVNGKGDDCWLWTLYNSGYGCRGEWRCLKAATLGKGNSVSPCQVVTFVRREGPGRSLISNLETAIKLSEIKPEDKIYFSSCLASPTPGCPYLTRASWPLLFKGQRALR